MTNIKQFQLLEDYNKQGGEAAKRHAIFHQRVKDEEQAVEDAEKELDGVIAQEIRTGREAPKTKADAYTKVDEAKKALEQAKKEQSRAYELIKDADDIKASDVVQAYINDYLPQVRAEELPAIQERMNQGQALILSALYDFYDKQREYRYLVDEIKEKNDYAARAEGAMSYVIRNPFEEHETLSGFNQHEFEKELNKALIEKPTNYIDSIENIKGDK